MFVLKILVSPVRGNLQFAGHSSDGVQLPARRGSDHVSRKQLDL